ncbi:MAG: hypothetical protein GYA17_21765 [Chloroflexi bacterium]|jgi:hypothetical protein|nr:transcriptional coactivator p15/PC4 family protein [Anaerolineaceae bacterium]NMB90999.1 hypothetical protein [Chloroflexota bacterium]
MEEKKLISGVAVREKLILQVAEFKGKARLDLRHYYESEGESLPSKKGINLPLEEVPQLVRDILAIYNEATGSQLGLQE